MKYYVIAGEASGDLHASNLMKGIKEHDINADFRCFGGDLMQNQGAVVVKHYRDLAFMGFIEVILNLRTISDNFNLCKKEILSYKPDVVILVDYPGFNLRMAKFAKKKGFKVFYYIAPKVWAWNESRVKILKKYVDQLFVIFPFEINYFKKHGITPVYEGNPLVDAIATRSSELKSFGDFIENNNLPDKPIIALVAGSRKQEIKYNLPVMLKMTLLFPGYQFVIAGAPSLKPEVYNKYLRNYPVSLVFNQTYQLIKVSTIALVTSGTATLEAALLKTPEVVCYRGGFFSMLIAWMVIKVEYISLVNLIMEKEVVKELKQYDLNIQNLYIESNKLFPGSSSREEMLTSFVKIEKMLGDVGSSRRIGEKMVYLLKSQTQQ